MYFKMEVFIKGHSPKINLMEKGKSIGKQAIHMKVISKTTSSKAKERLSKKMVEFTKAIMKMEFSMGKVNIRGHVEINIKVILKKAYDMEKG